jgi:site-specific DNA-methyltransferase (adenine-specific)
MNRIVQGDNLAVLQGMAAGSVELIYVDPPFNTGKRQSRTQMKTIRDEQGDRVGFGGRRYRTEVLAEQAGGGGYGDRFEDFPAFLRPRMVEAYRVLTATGSLLFHIDYREVHYCKVMLDEIFGRECFQNEIIWAYDYGARATKRWPAKHDNILWYTKDPKRFTFNLNATDRIPYMAPGLVGAKKAARGKTPTDVWWHTIVSPTGKEKTGYATQKPLGILERMVRVHSNAGETVLDFFAGSGTAGEAAAKHGRSFVMVDQSAAAVAVMEKRLKPYGAEKEDAAGGKVSKPKAAGAAKVKTAKVKTVKVAAVKVAAVKVAAVKVKKAKAGSKSVAPRSRR